MTRTFAGFLFFMMLSGMAQAQTSFPPEQAWPGTTTPQALTMPAYRASTTDPYTGARITRISSNSMPGGNTSQAIYYQHDYSKVQPWNADMTLFKLIGAVNILNTSDWTVFKSWNFHNDSRWSTVDPDILFYTTGTQFRKINVRTATSDAQSTLIYNFCTSTPFNCSNIEMGPSEGNLSIGDGKVVFKAGTMAILFNIATQTVLATNNSIGANMSDWISVDQSGNYVVACSNTGAGTHVYSATTLAYVRQLNSSCQHADMGYSFAGNEVYAQQCSNTYIRLDNAASQAVTPSGCNGHLSLRNYNRPGWACNSQFGYVYCKRLDSTNIVGIWAHHRSTEVNYDAQAKGVVSPDGKKMAWNSDWGTGGTVYTFVADFPSAGDTTPPASPSGLYISKIVR